MADTEKNPLLETLPPATDHLTYLTMLEYHLNVGNLPTLHKVLQDEDLTSQIGWDLVQLLLPLLPQAEECLEDVARLGNPREVVLKVTEALRQIDFNPGADTAESDSEADGKEEAIDSLKRLAISEGKDEANKVPESKDTTTTSSAAQLPLPVAQFQTLTTMLSILHPRIKTKNPSRFLSTSLQAILATYSEATTHKDDLTASVIRFVTTLSGTKRPHLPPRSSSSRVPSFSSQLIKGRQQGALEETGNPRQEKELFQRLLQSFVTHVLEDYMSSLTSTEDVPGLALCSRLEEKLHPERVIPGRKTLADQFQEDGPFQERSAVVGQLVALAQDLDLDSAELYAAIMDLRPEEIGSPEKEEEPPSSAADVPLSKIGCLYLLTLRIVYDRLFSGRMTATIMPIFPSHAKLLQNFVGMDNPNDIGLEPEAIIDSVLVFGLLAVEDDQVGEPTDNDHFTSYLQTTSLLSSKTASPSLRYYAHFLTSSILRSHPSDLIRFSFIRDTLEHCPFENLKTSAVSWLKGETLEANMATLSRHPKAPVAAKDSDETPSIFATPIALSTISPFLFPDLTHDLRESSLVESWSHFKLNLSFYLAALNFYYLLLSAKPLHDVLDIPGLHETADIAGSYLQPLRDAIARFRAALSPTSLTINKASTTDKSNNTAGDSEDESGKLVDVEGEEGVKSALGEFTILEDVLDRITVLVARVL